MVTVIIVFAVFLFIIILAAVRIVNEYERGVVFRLGRYVGVGARASSCLFHL